MIKGKKGIIFGIANDHSIAWGIAKQLYLNGAELAITYQNDTLLKRVKPLAEKVESNTLIECDVTNEDHILNTVKKIKNKFGKIDFIIHAVAYSDKNELNGRYIDTSKDNFINSLSISCYSFTKIAKEIISNNNKMHTTTDLKNAINKAMGTSSNKILSRVFQAIRIGVNNEISDFKETIKNIPLLLKKGGRIVIISFHSIEDRIVKFFLKNYSIFCLLKNINLIFK